MLSLHKIKRVLDPVRNTMPEDNFRLLDSWTVYENKSTDKEKPLDYIAYKIERMDPETGKKFILYKAVKFARVVRIPKSAKQSTSLMDMQTQVLSGAAENHYNLVTIIGNIIKPVPLGLLYLYGVQGVATTLEEAVARAHEDYVGLTGALMGTFRTLHLRSIIAAAAEWLREKMFDMNYLTVVRGIPKANTTGEDMGNKGFGGTNLNPDSQGTIEEIVTAMADHEYIIQVLSTPVYMRTLEAWSAKTQKQMTEWQSQMQGQKSLSFNLSIPFMYMASNGSAQGWSRSMSNTQTRSFTTGESYNTGYSHNVGSSLSQSLGKSFGLSRGSSLTNTSGTSHSISNGITQGRTQGITQGQTIGQTQGQTEGLTQGRTSGRTFGQTQGTSSSVSIGNTRTTSLGTSIGQSQGISAGRNTGTSTGMGYNQSKGYSTGQSFGQSRGTSYNETVGNTYTRTHSLGQSQTKTASESHSFSQSRGASDTQSQTKGLSLGLSGNDGVSLQSGGNGSVSGGKTLGGNDGHTDGSGNNVSAGAFGANIGGSRNQSDTSTASRSDSAQGSLGLSAGLGDNSSNGASAGLSAGANRAHGDTANVGRNDGYSLSDSYGKTETWSTGESNSYSKGYGASYGENQSINYGNNVSSGSSLNVGQSQGASYGMNAGSTRTQNMSQSNSISYNVSNGQTFSQSQSVSQSDSLSNSYSQSLSNSVSNSQSQSVSDSLSQSQSVSDGTSQSQSIGQSQSESYTQSNSTSVGQTEGESNSVSQGTSKGTSEGSSYGLSNGVTGTYTQGTSGSMGLGPSIGYNKSYQWIDQQVKDIVELLEFQNERLKRAIRGEGAFYTCCYIACDDMDGLSIAQAAAKATWQNEFALTNPLQVLDLTEEEQSKLLYQFTAFSMDPTRENVAGVSEYKYETVLLSHEYVAYTHLPRISEGGIDATINDIPKFRVPAMLKGNIYMGTILSAERYTYKNGYRTQHDYRINIDELMHGVFTGQSRSGKTVAAMRFISELAHSRRTNTGKRLRIVIMDPKQDWRGIARFVEPERLNFWSLGNALFHPINFNPCKIPRGVQPQYWIDGLVNIYCRAYGLLERGKQMLSEAFYDLYEKAGIFDAANEEGWEKKCSDLSGKITFAHVYDWMEKKKLSYENGKSKSGGAGYDTKDAYARLIERLSCFSRPYAIERKLFSKTTLDDERDQNGNLTHAIGDGTGIGIDELIGKDDVTIFESFGLESTFSTFIFGVITSGFYKVAKGYEGGFLHPEQYETVLVIEEANKVLTGSDVAGTSGGGGDASLAGQSEFEEILDQAAGYGLFIMAITQKISMMPSSIVANCGLLFVGKLSSTNDVNVAVRMMGREERMEDRDVVKWLPMSPTGWFICRSSRGYDFRDAEPVLVQIEMLNAASLSNKQLEAILTRKTINRILNPEGSASVA